MSEKQEVHGQIHELGKDDLAAALIEAANAMSTDLQIDESTWRDMRERQLLARRSLKSNTRMSGPPYSNSRSS